MNFLKVIRYSDEGSKDTNFVCRYFQESNPTILLSEVETFLNKFTDNMTVLTTKIDWLPEKDFFGLEIRYINTFGHEEYFTCLVNCEILGTHKQINTIISKITS